MYPRMTLNFQTSCLHLLNVPLNPIYAVLGIEPRVSHILTSSLPTDLYLQYPTNCIYYYFNVKGMYSCVSISVCACNFVWVLWVQSWVCILLQKVLYRLSPLHSSSPRHVSGESSGTQSSITVTECFFVYSQ